jgi:hypothetical protein
MDKENLKNIIKKHLKDFVRIAELSEKKINKVVGKYIQRVKGISNKNSFWLEKPHCLIDWVVLAENGEMKAISFLKFLTDLLENSLLLTVNGNMKLQIKSKAKEIFSIIDINVDLENNPQYMNFIMELAFLEYTLKQRQERFKIISIEKKMPNGKKADFQVEDSINNDEIYLEIVSINTLKLDKLNSSSDLEEFLKGRFNQKLESKTKGLNEKNNRIEDENGNWVNFAIIPMISCEIKDLMKYKDVFIKLDNESPNVFNCFSLLPENIGGSYTFTFSEVKNILERLENDS